ncbi:MAG TPA: hypothetical protein VFR15_15730 [Chloroflexia bacterium]|nr:hypothetical protein [Chloroflexia bacterium]
MINYISHQANKSAAAALALLVCVALALALAPPASAQTSGGRLGGAVTVTGGNASGITVELRQRSNGGEDTLLATATTNDQGMYEFTGQPSAPNDAFYYVKFSGGTGTLAAWYSFPIIYVSGSDFTVPSVEMADVKLMLPQGAALSLPNSLQWNPRRSGETYRVFVYAAGQPDKAVLDSGSLGMRTEFALAEGALPNGSYEAVVQVRDAVVGYGQSRARFTFTIGPAPTAAPTQPLLPPMQPTAAPAPAAPAPPSLGQGEAVPPAQTEPQAPAAPAPAPAQPQQPAAPGQAPTGSDPGTGPAPAAPGAAGQAGSPSAGSDPAPNNPGGAQPATEPGEEGEGEIPAGAYAPAPDVQVSVSADRTEVQQGQGMVYRVEVINQGRAEAQGVVVTDELPAGVVVDPAATRSTHGTVFIEGSRVTVQVGTLPPEGRAVVDIPVSVAGQAGMSIVNQATVEFSGAETPVQSNSLVAQVAAPAAAPEQAPAASMPKAPVEEPAQAPAQTQPQEPAQTQPQAPAQAPVQTQPQAPAQAPAKSQPQAPAKKPVAAPPASTSGSAQQAPPAAKQNAPIPKTGGGFPVVFALVVLMLTLFVRYLRGRTYRRV